MAIINTTGTFTNNEQVTSTKLNDIVDNAYFISGAVSGSTLEVTSGGQLKVGTITSSEIGANAVTASAILNGEVTVAKLSTGAPAWTSGGNVTVLGSTTALSSVTATTASVSIGSARTASGASNIDFNSTFPLTSYEARISRESGANGNLVVTNTGTGSLVLGTAPIPTPSGTAPVYGARAWVNFDGTTTTPTIRSSGNVTSVVKTAAGNYLVTLTTSLGNTDYAVIATSGNNLNLTSTTVTDNAFIYEDGLARTSNSFRIRVKQDDGGSSEDRKFVSVVVFG